MPNPDASRGAAILACGEALAGAELARSGLDQEAEPVRLRVLVDTAALARHHPHPAAPAAAGAVETELFRLLLPARAAALAAGRYPGVAANLLALAARESPWRGALLRVAWSRLAGAPLPRGVWETRFSDGLEGHWRRLRLGAGDGAAFRAAALPLLELLARRLAAAGITLAEETPSIQLPGDAADGSAMEAGEGEQLAEDGADGLEGAGPAPALPPGPLTDYRPYTRRFDEVIDARRLLPAEQLNTLRAHLDRSLDQLPPVVRRLAARLQRKLQARRQPLWKFDQEDGVIDGSRLAPFIAAPGAARIFKQALEAPFNGAAVTLLVDNSGSMKGQRILLAALCADLLAQALERCAVRVEVLGFTTRDWDGGAARASWERGGAPAQPGRLNGLRHIIYKEAALPWRRARSALAAMLHEPLLKENIDGEALLWAHGRLLRRPEAHRVLVVISDGAPHDEATIAANGRDLLERHLHESIAWIEAHSPVKLVAIGIGHHVSRYYRDAVTITDVKGLGEALIGKLAEALLPE